MSVTPEEEIDNLIDRYGILLAGQPEHDKLFLDLMTMIAIKANDAYNQRVDDLATAVDPHDVQNSL